MSLNYSIVLGCSLLLLGCGGADKPETKAVINLPAPVVVEVVPEVIQQPAQEDIVCTGIARLNFDEAIASEELAGYSASNAIDNKFLSQSRWSASAIDQSLILSLDTAALVKGLAITWLNVDNRSYSFDVEVSKDKETWLHVLSNESSEQLSTRSEFINTTEHTANYIKIIARGNTVDTSSHIVEVEAFGCDQDVASTIELEDWYLSIPANETTHTKAVSIYESSLNNDYFNAEFFFLDTDGGMVFRSPIEGAKTSTNTKYTRTELREMLRRGNTSIKTQGINGNNWVFSSATNAEQQAAGGVDGELISELAVNHVTETGDSSQVGRVIIGQIHANSDEPIRVYYRKLPGNEKGSIYLAHEILDGDDIYYELIGSRSKSAANPNDGIKLNQRFTYKITVLANQLTLTIYRDGQADVSQIVDMSNSGYDQGGQYMYFKAGVYNQNNTGDPKDYVQATFYKIENSHTGYLSD